MHAMMQRCQEHCSVTGRSIDDLNRKIEDAKKSNDPAKMRAALNDAQKPLADMKNHMNMCMSMMQQHSSMMGPAKKGRDHMKGMMGQQPQQQEKLR
jgi:hypothetical protein